jgi:glycine cleavage system H protein
MATVKYSKDHEWVRVDGDVATVGITDFAQNQLGDIVYVELPEIGRKVDQGKEIATVESVKAASEIYAPVSGEVIEVNSALTGEPGKVNADPQGEGWFFKLRLADAGQLDGLLDDAAYQELTEEQH